MKKITFILLITATALLALTPTEKACIQEKRAIMTQTIETCRQQYSDAKDISICAQAAKQQFAIEVKQCYEQK